MFYAYQRLRQVLVTICVAAMVSPILPARSQSNSLQLSQLQKDFEAAKLKLRRENKQMQDEASQKFEGDPEASKRTYDQLETLYQEELEKLRKSYAERVALMQKGQAVSNTFMTGNDTNGETTKDQQSALDVLEIQYKTDLSTLDDEQGKEYKASDFSKLSAQDTILASNRLNEKYRNKRDVLKLAYEEEKRLIKRGASARSHAQWDSAEKLSVKSQELTQILKGGSNNTSVSSTKPDALEVTAAIVAGVAVYAIGRSIHESEAYAKMTPEQKRAFDAQKAEDRRQIDEMNERNREQDRREDQIARDTYRMYGKEPYWAPLPGNY